jgi:hypothetical protein
MRPESVSHVFIQHSPDTNASDPAVFAAINQRAPAPLRDRTSALYKAIGIFNKLAFKGRDHARVCDCSGNITSSQPAVFRPLTCAILLTYERGLHAIIIILEPLDIVFTQITSALHFYEFEIDLTRILEAVPRADRDVNRLIFVHYLHFISDCHSGGAAHDHPMLGPVMMELQRQSAALLHHNAFDLVALAQVE